MPRFSTERYRRDTSLVWLIATKDRLAIDGDGNGLLAGRRNRISTVVVRRVRTEEGEKVDAAANHG